MTRRNGRRAKSPAFQFYPADFLADPKVQCMTAEEIGTYLLLLCAEWLDGPLPADHDFLARIARLDRKRFDRAWVAVGRCFQPCETLPDRIENPRMEREREFQVENRKRLRENADKTNEKLGRATHSETQSDTLSDTRSDTPCDRSGVAPNTQRPTPVPNTRIPTPDGKHPPGKPGGSRAKPTGQLAECIQHWEAEWVRTRLGTKCVIQPKDGVAVAWMLKQADAIEVRRRMTAMLEDPDQWITDNAALPILRSKWDRFAVSLRVNGKHAPSYPGGAREMFLGNAREEPRTVTVDGEVRRA